MAVSVNWVGLVDQTANNVRSLGSDLYNFQCWTLKFDHSNGHEVRGQFPLVLCQDSAHKLGVDVRIAWCLGSWQELRPDFMIFHVYNWTSGFFARTKFGTCVWFLIRHIICSIIVEPAEFHAKPIWLIGSNMHRGRPRIGKLRNHKWPNMFYWDMNGWSGPGFPTWRGPWARVWSLRHFGDPGKPSKCMGTLIGKPYIYHSIVSDCMFGFLVFLLISVQLQMSN